MPAPTATVAPPVPSIASNIARKIKPARITGCISGAVTLTITLVAMAGVWALEFSGWSLLDVALIFRLSYGIYKKSRTCAVVMLVFFVISKIILMMEAGKPSGLLVALIFGYFYVQGILGTFAFHKFKGAQAREAAQAHAG